MDTGAHQRLIVAEARTSPTSYLQRAAIAPEALVAVMPGLNANQQIQFNSNKCNHQQYAKYQNQQLRSSPH
jgi:hypothetical protein